MTMMIGADSIDDLVGHLKSIIFDVKHRGSRGSVSGGYSAGGFYEISEDESITHETWGRSLNEYLESLPKGGSES
jgi:hypothetical protein